MLGGDGTHFSCGQCAAAPHLQDIQGCFTDAPRPFAKLATYEYTRCPVRYQSRRGLTLIRDAREQWLKSAIYKDKMKAPAKYLQALTFIDYLFQLKELRDGDRD